SLLYEGFSTLELPTYHNLRQLEVSSKMSSSATTALIDLLSFLPNLESIVIAKASPLPLSNIWLEYSSFGFFKLKKVDDSGKQKVPECLLLQLKAVKVREFYGSRREQNIISFFLKESLVLQTMDIVFSSTLAERWKDSQTLPQSLKDSSNLSQILKDGVMQRILTFPKGSTDCAINFSS
ncbi:hypothetical protein MKW94_017960, partial [Papaver nudicaule]|nr:hypothetical protein [Papaver nudicaule]